MRYYGNFAENIINAYKSQDKELLKELVYDENARLIEMNPELVVNALKESNVDVSSDASKLDLIGMSAYNIVNNPIFQRNLEVAIAEGQDYDIPNKDRFSNAEAGAEGSGGEGGSGSMVTAIAGAVGSIFEFGTSTQNLKSEEEKAKAAMYSKIFGEQKKRNYMPYIVVGGVLLIGALVVWRVTANRK